MDRFIVRYLLIHIVLPLHLKSNMDRFIGVGKIEKSKTIINLKSNMDRFIV